MLNRMENLRVVNRDVVGALIESGDGKFLLGKKPEGSGGVYPDCWQIPGGGMEEGEGKIEALIRELKEEIGLSVDPDSVKLFDDQGVGAAEKTLDDGETVFCEMKFFIYRIFLELPAEDITLIAGSDLESLTWFDQTELEDLELVPAGVELFKRHNFF